MKNEPIREQQGFTLVELMIVVAIISILAYVAVGSYGDSSLRAKRSDAHSSLLTTASALEKCKAVYGIYNNDNCSVSDGDTIDSAEDLYTITVDSAATTFSLEAKPQAGKSQADDSDCTTIVLNHLGQQTATGASAGDCW